MFVMSRTKSLEWLILHSNVHSLHHWSIALGVELLLEPTEKYKLPEQNSQFVITLTVFKLI